MEEEISFLSLMFQGIHGLILNDNNVHYPHINRWLSFVNNAFQSFEAILKLLEH